MYLDALLEESRIKGSEEGFTCLSPLLIALDSSYQLLWTHPWFMQGEWMKEKLGELVI